MIVTVITMRMMQVAVNEVVHVIAVRYGGMPATGAMDVVGIVSAAVVFDASVGIGLRDLDDMLVVMVLMGTVQVSIMEITDVVSVLNRYMSAAGAVLVIVVFMDFVCHLFLSPVLAVMDIARF